MNWWNFEQFKEYYNQVVGPLETQENAWAITSNRERLLSYYSQMLARARGPEYKKKCDGKGIDNRYYTGLAGEQAVHFHLGLGGDSLDFSVDFHKRGNRKYHHEDLRPFGVNVGIKASRIPFTPLINPKDVAEKAQIICSVYYPGDLEQNSDDCMKVHIFGMIPSRLLKDTVDMNMKMSEANSLKGGFFGYDKLRPVPMKLEELQAKYPWPAPPAKPAPPAQDEELFDTFIHDICK